jgi:hypothetical protein
MDNKSSLPEKPLDDGITTPAKSRRESRLVYLVAIGLVIVLGIAIWYASSRSS